MEGGGERDLWVSFGGIGDGVFRGEGGLWLGKAFICDHGLGKKGGGGGLRRGKLVRGEKG